MRKQQRNQILDIFLMFKEAHSQLRTGSEQERSEILASCQETAIEVGEIIEKEAGECQVITRLEEYCDLLYLALGRLATEEAAEICSRLDAQADAAGEEFIREIHTDYVVVFLPYKASMWDSMESVWQAFCRDEDCVSLVVPIPYFTRDQSGRAEDVHYEGGLFPDNIPVTYYDRVDLEKLHPDVIFIHNPYDANNFVTSIHTDYYCSRIHEYTDKLVYIPYFVSMEKVDRSYCLQPGIAYSDKVILQSETIKEQYQRFFSEAYGVEKVGDKFAALGSPKFDGVLKDRQQFHMPKEWKDRIRNKKIILYNTHLKSLLESGEDGIDKMERTIYYLKEREDVILWWRPHPLSEATAQAMRPELMKRYHELIKICKNDDSMIFDDTPQLDRAIVCSDGYYGDYSSLIPLYLMTGKPVMHQQVCFKMNDCSPVFMDCMAEDDDSYWYPSGISNELFRTDKMTNQTELVCRLEAEENRGFLYGGICLYGSKVILIPRMAERIAVWDKLSNKLTYIDYKLPNSKYRKAGHFAGNAVYGKYLYLFGIRCPVILRLDLESYGIKYYESWYKKIFPFLQDNGKDLNNIFFTKNLVIQEEFIYAPIGCAPFVLCLNMKTEEIKLYRIGKEKDGFVTISSNGPIFWMVSASGSRIVKWNMNQNMLVEYTEFPEGFESSGWAFGTSITIEGYILFIPYNAKMILKVNTMDNKITQLNWEVYEGNEVPNDRFFVQALGKDRIRLIGSNKKIFTELSLFSNETRKYQYTVKSSEKDFSTYLSSTEKWPNRYPVFEEGIRQLTLGGFADYLANGLSENPDIPWNYKKRLSSNLDGTSGMEIYKYIKDQM